MNPDNRDDPAWKTLWEQDDQAPPTTPGVDPEFARMVAATPIPDFGHVTIPVPPPPPISDGRRFANKLRQVARLYQEVDVLPEEALSLLAILEGIIK